jgi:hypothetical protein
LPTVGSFTYSATPTGDGSTVDVAFSTVVPASPWTISAAGVQLIVGGIDPLPEAVTAKVSQAKTAHPTESGG